MKRQDRPKLAQANAIVKSQQGFGTTYKRSLVAGLSTLMPGIPYGELYDFVMLGWQPLTMERLTDLKACRDALLKLRCRKWGHRIWRIRCWLEVRYLRLVDPLALDC